MCLPLIAAGIGAVGSVMSGISGYQSQKAQSDYAARQARMEQQKGAYEEGRLSDQNNRQLASMRSDYLSSGIALDGSALDILQDSATEASLDEQAIKYSAQVRSDNLMFESKLAKSNATQSLIGGGLGALSSMVSGLSQNNQQNQMRTMVRNPYAMYGS